MIKKKLATMAIAGLAVTAFAACGDDDGGDTPDDTGTETPDSGGGDVTTPVETMATTPTS